MLCAVILALFGLISLLNCYFYKIKREMRWEGHVGLREEEVRIQGFGGGT